MPDPWATVVELTKRLTPVLMRSAGEAAAAGAACVKIVGAVAPTGIPRNKLCKGKVAVVEVGCRNCC